MIFQKHLQKHTFLYLVYFILKFKLMVTISDFCRIDWDWFSWRTHYCFYPFLLFSDRFFIYSVNKSGWGVWSPAPVSIKARHFMPPISIITKGYVTWVSFVVNWIFDVFSQIEVWCFLLQLTHDLFLQQSEVRCLEPVQVKHNFF